MLVDTNTGACRLPKHKLSKLRQRAATNGFVVNTVSTVPEAIEAHLKALSPKMLEDLLHFVDTGISPFTKESTVEDFKHRYLVAQPK